jgi:hypothetical protein
MKQHPGVYHVELQWKPEEWVDSSAQQHHVPVGEPSNVCSNDPNGKIVSCKLDSRTVSRRSENVCDGPVHQIERNAIHTLNSIKENQINKMRSGNNEGNEHLPAQVQAKGFSPVCLLK